ncbi:DUF2187 family protein [Loigolactobacillus coryniformis]|jgi:uncharacterized protein YkvS|uniref:DUF2187 domain-containing protein n=3 Tax=Loigolactobacillus coryniformis TaxID=1610 RepID=A0A2D1KRA4_9LACO|nr:DUF2187 family protein [Loigolactobacillus coryniformis]MDT3392820.1 DUF2187 family protein [Bacillota bacterium]OEH89609.1 hypothetical protein ATO00_09985 [Loigolactobacillus coryniformis subsp. coryniformis]RRG02139.1 MAG: DUF2187 domain-containing protein [Lactobacillus sp.]ATO44621.1 DUF2187 domain-containing protein [Loigolactobacillus coryniformis subsp. torquens DSM 20004 = KCTC 3535]ATO56398.1 DUF2187 domain-containing protein [Loigolactobacillus coryniformis subsp. coryniformis KC
MDIQVGNTVRCKANGNMEADFSGVIEKVYENSALVNITDYDAKTDSMNIQDLQNKAVISFGKMKLVSAK